jgi:hypothetical protein
MTEIDGYEVLGPGRLPATRSMSGSGHVGVWPCRGLVRTRNNMVKQDGKVALTCTPLRIIKARNAG